MQIILVQAEIEAAIRAYIAPFIASEGVSVSIDMSATRGTDGFKALIDIVPLGQEVLTDEPATLGIADKIAEAKADAPAEVAPARRTRRTAAQIAADNAAAAAQAAEGNLSTTDAANEGILPAGDESEDKILGTDTSGSTTSTSSTATTAASPSEDDAPLAAEAAEEASDAAADQSQPATNEEAAPAPRQSLFGNLNAVKN